MGIQTEDDPLAMAHARMQAMDKKELMNLVLIAANRIGIATHGDTEDPLKATATFVDGINTLFSAYDTAVFNSMSSQGATWGVNYAQEC